MTAEGDSLYDTEAADEIRERLEAACWDVATELIARAGDALELTEGQRDGVRTLLGAAFSRGAAWEHDLSAGILEKALAPIMDVKLGRIGTPTS